MEIQRAMEQCLTLWEGKTPVTPYFPDGRLSKTKVIVLLVELESEKDEIKA